MGAEALGEVGLKLRPSKLTVAVTTRASVLHWTGALLYLGAEPRSLESPMADHAYYDKTLTKDALVSLLTQVHGKYTPSRSKSGKKVYSIDGGGEAMVEMDGSKYRVRIYKGKCPC